MILIFLLIIFWVVDVSRSNGWYLGMKNENDRLFNWCSGYHVCLTRRRSQVRSLDWTYFYFYSTFTLFVKSLNLTQIYQILVLLSVNPFKHKEFITKQNLIKSEVLPSLEISWLDKWHLCNPDFVLLSSLHCEQLCTLFWQSLVHVCHSDRFLHWWTVTAAWCMAHHLIIWVNNLTVFSDNAWLFNNKSYSLLNCCLFGLYLILKLLQSILSDKFQSLWIIFSLENCPHQCGLKWSNFSSHIVSM